MTPGFEALALIFVEQTGREIIFESADYGWSAGKDWILIPEDDTEGLLHELCHWVMAGPRRRLYCYGLSGKNPSREMREEHMCGWVEDWLYERAGLTRPRSSVDQYGYRDAPKMRGEGLRRWRRTISPRLTGAVVNALRLPGGQRGMFR